MYNSCSDRICTRVVVTGYIISIDIIYDVLGEYAKFRKVTISFVKSVSPSVRLFVRMQQLGFHWMDYDET